VLLRFLLCDCFAFCCAFPLRHQPGRLRRRGKRGKALQRKRSEVVERSFAHTCETGGARRCWLRGIEKVRKRYAIAAAAHNLSVMMRALFNMRTPRGLQQFNWV
jgi:hypothetical protein